MDVRAWARCVFGGWTEESAWEGEGGECHCGVMFGLNAVLKGDMAFCGNSSSCGNLQCADRFRLGR